MSDAAPRRRSPFARPVEEGPRASVRDLLPYLREHRRVLVVVVVLSLLGAAAQLAQPLVVSQVIGLVQAGRPLGVLAATLVVLVIVAGLINAVQHYLLQRTGTSIVFSARRRLVSRILRLPIAEFDRRRTGDLVSRVGSDTTLLYAVMTQGLVDAVGGAVQFLGALVAMAIIDPVLLGLTVLVVAIAIGAVTVLSRYIRVASREQQNRLGDLTASVERSIGAIRTVRAANATQRETEAIDADAKRVYDAGVKVARASAGVVPVAGIAMNLAFLVVLGVGGFRVASGAIPIASLVAFILFLFLMILPLGSAFGAFTSVNQALGALGRIGEVLALPEETGDDAALARTASDPVSAPSSMDPAAVADAAIAFDDVRFGYAGGGEVLHGVTFQATRGTRTALVGPSGAGKSTILALVERFYDPTAGRILMDGVDLRSLDRDRLRSQIGYVEQDAPVLAGSIRQNLLLAAPAADEAACIDVLHRVNLGEVLERDPAGLDAQVGEDGVMLSGGERQRLAIARALLAAPPVLLLDESTSSLDGLNEQLLREAIDAVAEERTLIVIAHRLSTVVDSDRIVVLDHGEVAGIGTHSELVQQVPLYRDLAKHQLLV